MIVAYYSKYRGVYRRFFTVLPCRDYAETKFWEFLSLFYLIIGFVRVFHVKFSEISKQFSNIFQHCEGKKNIFYIMSLSPSLFSEIFCIKHLNWILKTAELTESSGRLDERPVKNGEIDGVNPQTRQSDRQADKTKRDWQRKRQLPKTTTQTVIRSPVVYMCTLMHLDISPAVHDSSISAMHTSSL